MAVPFDDPTIRASVIAHTIRLGKCPAAGQVIEFSMRIAQVDADDLAANRLDSRVPVTPKVLSGFTVTEADLAAGRKLINDQEAQYSEPKMTKVKLRKE